MSIKKINRIVFWGISCICMVLLMISFGKEVCSAENTHDGSGTAADVSNWLAELDRHSAVVPHSVPQAVSTLKQDRNAGSSSHRKREERHKKSSPGRISIDFYKVDLHNVFRLLGQVSKKNIVVDEDVKGTLTLALQDVPWTFVLQIIKNLKGLSSREINNTIMIYPSSKKMAWEAEGVSQASLDFNAGDAGIDSSGGLSIERIASSGGEGKLEIEGTTLSKVPPEQVSVAVKLIKQADAAIRTDRLDEAEELLRKACDLWYDNPVLIKKTANVALKNGDELSGYNYGRKALELDPSDSEAAAITAVALARMSKAGEAKTYFERAMAGRNVSLDTLWNYAVFSFSHNDFRSALRLITRIEASYSLTPDLMMLKARTYENLFRKEKAIQEYRTILTAGKDIPPEMMQFARIRLQSLTSGTETTGGEIKYEGRQYERGIEE